MTPVIPHSALILAMNTAGFIDVKLIGSIDTIITFEINYPKPEEELSRLVGESMCLSKSAVVQSPDDAAQFYINLDGYYYTIDFDSGIVYVNNELVQES